MSQPIRLLILGTGGMAHQHAEKFAQIAGVTLVAGVDTRAAQLQEFCDRHTIAHRFASVQEALAWGQFDAVTNVTPDAAHFQTTMPVLAARKHILCEKPLATSAPEATAMADAAKAAGVVNMINLSYRNVAALQAAALMVAQGAIGTIRHFEASYFQSWLTQPAWGHWDRESQWLWRLSRNHGSKGVLGDVGIHILDFATFVAGQSVAEVSCRLATFDKAPGGQIGEYVLDANDSATMQLVLENGALGTVSATRFASGHLNDLALRLYGNKGGIQVLWEKDISRLRVCVEPNLQSATWVDIDTPVLATIYERFIGAIRGEMVAGPDFDRGADLQKMLDCAEQSAAKGGLSVQV
jgi:predicted dehydrogenase